MNTNNNVYTVIYTTIVCVLVAAVLAIVSQALGPKQQANEKAETISQILTAAQFLSKEECSEMGNDAVIKFYKENIAYAITIKMDGSAAGELDIEAAQIYTVPQLKAQNYLVKDTEKGEAVLPVYIFSNGTTVIPIYGAGLWGPIWGYMAFESDLNTVKGAYFDHESETPGLGGKIKDDPKFRAQFSGKTLDWNDVKPFAVIKGGANGKTNGVDAITGATMTSNGVSEAVNVWLGAYKSYLTGSAATAVEHENAEEEATVESDTIKAEEE